MTEKTAAALPAAGAGERAAGQNAIADLTADTFVAVIAAFGTFDPGKGTARAWTFGIARRVYASHCEAHSQQQHKLERLAGRRELAPDQVEELLALIDAERAGRDLITGLVSLPGRDRAVIELVDLAGLRPKEAAVALGLTPGAIRMRLLRSRVRLRGQATTGVPPRSGPAAHQPHQPEQE